MGREMMDGPYAKSNGAKDGPTREPGGPSALQPPGRPRRGKRAPRGTGYPEAAEGEQHARNFLFCLIKSRISTKSEVN